MFFEEFYMKYFAQPGYTTVQTIIYAFLLFIAIYLIYHLFLKKLDRELDNSFLLSLVPFILLAGVLRSLGPGDAEVLSSFWFNTPGLHLLVTAYAIPSILASQTLERRTERSFLQYMWILGSLPLMFGVMGTFSVGFKNPAVFGMVLGTAAVIAAPLYLVTYYRSDWLSKVNHYILSGHIIDGSSTFITVSFFGYAEKHVLPGFLSEAVGIWSMIPLKIAVVWPVLYLLDDIVDEQGFRTWLKAVVLSLGLALGTRNTFTAAMGV